MTGMDATDTALHVRAFSARHRAASADGLARCKAVQQQLLDGELEAALAALVGDDEVVVMRRLQLQLTLNAARSDSDNARRWGDGLGQALARALRHAPARDLQRFAHRRQALQTFVADAIAGTGARDWVWQRLGWLPASASGAGVSAAARHGALLRWLADDEQASVPLLRGLLPTAAWPALVAQLAEAELRGLATSVLARIGGAPQAAFVDATVAAPAVSSNAAPAAAITAIAGWPAALRASWQAAATPACRRWALRLAWMLNDPPLARSGAAAVDAAIAQALAGPGDGASAAATAAGATSADPTVQRKAVGNAPARQDAPTTPAAPEPDTQTAWTRFGGLLLLLPLLPRCNALPVLEDAAVWPAGGLLLALHRLALQLLPPLAADDPAALAFCGLAPQAEVPAAGHDLSAAQQAAQQAALQQAQARLAALLASALPGWPASGLVDRVARRRARISAEAGWVDVHFALRDVSLDLRRAALDLDPGFIPWLGLVLRYRYE